MIIPAQFRNIMTQLQSIEAKGKPLPFSISATILTDTVQIPVVYVDSYSLYSDYMINVTDLMQITVHINPSFIKKYIIPNKDKLALELCINRLEGRYVCKFTAIPCMDDDPNITGNTGALSNTEAFDDTVTSSYTFQLLDTGYAKIMNASTGGNFIIANIKDVLHHLLTTSTKNANLTGVDTFKGVNIEDPVDNLRTYRNINIPPMRLIELPKYIQGGDGLGLYNTGLGSYYTKGLWRIYPLFRLNRAGVESKDVLNIYRVPPDMIPGLESTYFVNDRVVNIVATGNAAMISENDIKRLNKGTGQRVVNADSLTNDYNVYVNNGRAVRVRTATVAEYRTAQRAEDNEFIPLSKPTNNICAKLTENSMNDVQSLSIEWVNSNHDLLIPGMSVNYYYIHEDGGMKKREGTLAAAKTGYVKDTATFTNKFRSSSLIGLLLGPELSI